MAATIAVPATLAELPQCSLYTIHTLGIDKYEILLVAGDGKSLRILHFQEMFAV